MTYRRQHSRERLCTFGFKEALSADHGTRRAGRQRSAPKPIGLWIISASGDQLVRTGTAPAAQNPGLLLACAAACAAPPRRPKTPRSHRHITAHRHADHRSRRRPSTRKRSRAAARRPAATAPRAPAGAGLRARPLGPRRRLRAARHRARAPFGPCRGATGASAPGGPNTPQTTLHSHGGPRPRLAPKSCEISGSPPGKGESQDEIRRVMAGHEQSVEGSTCPVQKEATE